MRLKGKVAFITGAANGLQGELKGIGGATAWLFAREGAKVVLGDVNDELSRRTASQIRNSGYEAQFIHLDVASASEWSEGMKTTVDRFGRLDVLVNCAGNREPNSYTVEETPEELWDEVMDTHARGTFLGMKHAVPKMRDSAGGSIINISSVLGRIGMPGYTAYCSSKHGLIGFTRALALELAPRGITVNAICPGWVETDMTLLAIESGAEAAGITYEGFRRKALDQVPLKEMIQPQEIGELVFFLSSDSARNITGQSYNLCGGQVMN